MAIAGVPCPLARANGSATANDTAVCCVTPAFTAGANPAALNLTLSVPEVGSALLALALTLALALNLALALAPWWRSSFDAAPRARAPAQG